jgi:hypothetical protein
MNNNQHDAPFVFSLLGYHTFTYFGRISSVIGWNGTGFLSSQAR